MGDGAISAPDADGVIGAPNVSGDDNIDVDDWTERRPSKQVRNKVSNIVQTFLNKNTVRIQQILDTPDRGEFGSPEELDVFYEDVESNMWIDRRKEIQDAKQNEDDIEDIHS